MNNQSKDYVYSKFNDLKEAIEWDSFNLSRNQHDFLDLKMTEFKRILDEQYNKYTKSAEPELVQPELF